jgi:ribokinase
VNRVVVLGSINRDLVLTLEHLPVPGETVTASHLKVLSGGKGANQAAAAAAIGGDVAMVGRVGTDAAGREQVSALAAGGVDVTSVRKDPRAPTGTAVVMVDGAGRNSIVVVPGANALLDAVSVEQAAPLIERARILLLQLEIPDDAVDRAVAVARRAHVMTILNLAPGRLPARQ